MKSIRETREKLNCSQEEMARYLKIIRPILTRIESDKRRMPEKSVEATAFLFTEIAKADEETAPLEELQKLLDKNQSEALEKLRKRREETRLRWNRAIRDQQAMKKYFDKSTRALNYLLRLQKNGKQLTAHQRDWIEIRIDQEKKNILENGPLAQHLADIKIAGLEAEINSLNSILSIQLDIMLESKTMVQKAVKNTAPPKN
jgi:transcriptional regulator with XRE-family HTH domain